MAYINTRPIIAEDTLAYFTALDVLRLKPAPVAPVVPALPALRALEQMYGYYSAD